jgi:dephospho-CoA kinase
MSYVVAITGGIGSGKSAVADAFARRGIEVIDTDAIAHALTAPRGTAIEALRKKFGDEIITPEGALDRAKMRARAFSDPAARRELEAVLHPLIRAESVRRVAASGSPYVVLVVPLLVESGVSRYEIQRVLVVDCEEDRQVERVIARSGLAAGEVRRIMRSQASRAERLRLADDVIENDGVLAELDEEVETVHQLYLRLARLGHAHRPETGGD